jgi:hypothetical protein
LTLGSVARRYGLSVWQVRRIYERGLMPPAARAGMYRIVTEGQLPAIEAALRQAGYLRPVAGETRGS